MRAARALCFSLCALTPASTLAEEPPPPDVFHFPAPVREPLTPPPSLFRHATPQQRAGRALAEVVTAAALCAGNYVLFDPLKGANGQNLKSLAPLIAPALGALDVALVGYALGARGNFIFSLLGGVTGFSLASIFSLVQAAPVGVGIGVLASAALFELTSYLNELQEERDQELAFLDARPRAKEETIAAPALPVEILKPAPKTLVVRRAFSGFGVAALMGVGVGLGVQASISAAGGCSDWCRIDPTSKNYLHTFNLIAIPIALVLTPFVVHFWGQWWGGRGKMIYAVLGEIAGLSIAGLLSSYLPGLASTWWGLVPAGAVAGWEISSRASERWATAHAYESPVPLAAPPAPEAGP
jgi:hypothetical protein